MLGISDRFESIEEKELLRKYFLNKDISYLFLYIFYRDTETEDSVSQNKVLVNLKFFAAQTNYVACE